MRKKLFINLVADFPDSTRLTEEDLDSIKEDIEDAVYYNGITKPSWRPLVEVEWQ